jgi:hypothetical protein
MLCHAIQAWMQIRSLKGTYKSVVAPGDALALVGVGVSVSRDLAGLSAPESVKVRSNNTC